MGDSRVLSLAKMYLDRLIWEFGTLGHCIFIGNVQTVPVVTNYWPSPAAYLRWYTKSSGKLRMAGEGDMRVYWTESSYKKWVKTACRSHPKELLAILLGDYDGCGVWIRDYVIPDQEATQNSVYLAETPADAYSRYIQSEKAAKGVVIIGTIHTHCSTEGEVYSTTAPSITDIVSQGSWELVWAIHHITKKKNGKFEVDKPVFYHRIVMIEPEIAASRMISRMMQSHRMRALKLQQED